MLEGVRLGRGVGGVLQLEGVDGDVGGVAAPEGQRDGRARAGDGRAGLVGLLRTCGQDDRDLRDLRDLRDDGEVVLVGVGVGAGDLGEIDQRGVPDSVAGMSGSRMTGMLMVTVVASGRPIAPGGSGRALVKVTSMALPSTVTSELAPAIEMSPLSSTHGGSWPVSTALVQPPKPVMVQVTVRKAGSSWMTFCAPAGRSVACGTRVIERAISAVSAALALVRPRPAREPNMLHPLTRQRCRARPLPRGRQLPVTQLPSYRQSAEKPNSTPRVVHFPAPDDVKTHFASSRSARGQEPGGWQSVDDDNLPDRSDESSPEVITSGEPSSSCAGVTGY